MNLSLAYSPCPNDTYIFYALAHGKIRMENLEFDIRLNDVEVLNQAAKAGAADISKLSFAALGHLLDAYGLLRTGAALGRGCGPLVVGRPGADLRQLSEAAVAVPGLWTTAHLLLGLFCPTRPRTLPMRFDRIMPTVAEGSVDFGVIIHEGRFTYEEYGLVNLLDLGAWWESETGLPIPLGGIAARRSLPPEVIQKTETGIRESILYARSHPEETRAYVRAHAQELSDRVKDQHIRLYVNDFSLDIGESGTAAVWALFSRAREKGLLPAGPKNLFALPNS